MATQSIVCGSCAATVPYGRLSCPSCGELLASVAGGRRVVAGAALSGGTPVSLWDPAAEAPSPDPELDGGAGRGPDLGPDRGPVPGPDRGPVLGPDRGPDLDPVPGAGPEPAWRPEPSVLMPVQGATWASDAAGSVGLTMPLAAPGAYVPPRLAAPMPAASAAGAQAASLLAGGAAAGGVAAIPAGPAAPARTWAGHGSAAGTAAAAASPADGARAGEDAPGRLAEFVRWLAVAGSALAAVGFLLPLASSVIGATGVGYLDRAGLAGPAHIVVVAALLGVLAAALAGERIPLWIRVGLPGLGFGAMLVGLVWPYVLVEALQAGPGAYAILAGASLLLVSGVVTLVADRHGSLDRSV